MSVDEAQAKSLPSILVNETTGMVVSETHADNLWHPASLTKLMTVYLAFKAIRDGRLSLSTPVVMSSTSTSKPPSKLGLPVGHGLPLDDAIRITLTRSMNDVAAAIGETVAQGSEARFVTMMNSEARRLGMLSTTFTNASGLPDNDQVSTARDLAILAVALTRDFPQYDRYFSIPSLGYGSKVFRNTNSLVGKFPGITGMKTGYICASGFNLVNRAMIDGQRYITVVLGAASPKERERITVSLLGQVREVGSKRRLQSTPATTTSATDLRSFGCGKTFPGVTSTSRPSAQKAGPRYVYEALGSDID